ncbi:MAG: right-handed parallel beta-helix repeat-containing protein [Verrucomicrobiia bacterium]
MLAASLGTPSAGATTYFVAVNGADANPGTSLAAPFQTIQHAAAIMTAGDTCFIRAGVYHETLAPSSSGSSNAPITFAAYANEVVTLDGADAVTGWTVLSNGIYQASVNWDLGQGYNQVFVDGAMIHQAQSPDYGNGDVLHPGTASVTVNSVNTNLITSTAWSGKPDNYWAGAWFLGGVGYAWAWQSARVLSSTGSTITVDPATTTANWWFTGSGSGFLWGNFNLLDADNEWHLQTNSGGNTLYLRISGGGNPATQTVELKRRNWCVDLNNRNYVTVSGLNLWAGAARLRGDGNVLLNCQGQFLSHFMIISQGYFENDNTDQGGGVTIAGNNNVVRACTLFNTAGSGVYSSSGNTNVITRNLIYNTDYSGTYACSIALHGSGDIVTFNTVHSSGRDILRPEGTGSDIRFNDLSNPGLLCKDLGVTYQWGVDGRGTRIAYNWAHDNSSANDPLRMGIYLDNWCRNFIVDHNVVWNCPTFTGIQINGPSFNHLIYNNTLFNCDDVGTHPYDQWPSPNPDPAFWTNDVYQYSASNNLFLANSPQTQLVNWTNEDFRLKPNAPAIDAGVVIPGFTDGYNGSAPDLGAYESGSLAWNAGVESRPTLAIVNAGAGTMTLTASPDVVDYRLYSATNLAPPAVWNPVTNLLFAPGGQWSVTLNPATNVASFYRLQSP